MSSNNGANSSSTTSNSTSTSNAATPTNTMKRSQFPALSTLSNDLPSTNDATTSTSTSSTTPTSTSANSNPKTSSLGRSTSLHSSSPRRSASSGFSSTSGAATPSSTTGGSGSNQSSRHLSFHHTRPVVPPPSNNRDLFGIAVASSNLATSSDGLQALLRDHPELVSSSLAAAAGPTFQEFNENSTRGSRKGSQKGSGNNTPQKEYGDLPLNDDDDDGDEDSIEDQDGAEAKGTEKSGRDRDHHAASNRPLSFSGILDAPSAGASTPAPNLGAAGAKPDYSAQKIVVAMVGLPARGKSYLSNRLMRYLRWLEYDVKVFNVGQLRRALARAKLKQSGVTEDHTASFFDPQNPSAYKLRTQMAEECLEQLIGWLKKGGNVGIHDATNSSKSRRAAIAARVAREPDLKLIFLESVCTDPAVIAANIAVKVGSGDPDYAGMSPEDAKADFLARIKHYEEGYEAVDADGTESHLSYCKITDIGRSVVVNQIHGYLESRIAFYLMNLHLTPRNIFFSRHGESEYNVQGKIGGDADLSPRGWAYAKALPQLIKDNIGSAPLTVWHSTLRRTGQTASLLPYPKLAWKSLDELDAGVCDSMTYEEIETFYPEDYASRDEDKFNYRYRGGESYRDVVVRLEPIIMELERQENILIIGHQAILRALYAYFHALSQEDLPYIKIPLHAVIQLTPKAYGCDEKRFQLPIEAVDTHRPKPPPREHVEEQLSASEEEADDVSKAATAPPPSMQKPPGA